MASRRPSQSSIRPLSGSIVLTVVEGGESRGYLGLGLEEKLQPDYAQYQQGRTQQHHEVDEIEYHPYPVALLPCMCRRVRHHSLHCQVVVSYSLVVRCGAWLKAVWWPVFGFGHRGTQFFQSQFYRGPPFGFCGLIGQLRVFDFELFEDLLVLLHLRHRVLREQAQPYYGGEEHEGVHHVDEVPVDVEAQQELSFSTAKKLFFSFFARSENLHPLIVRVLLHCPQAFPPPSAWRCGPWCWPRSPPPPPPPPGGPPPGGGGGGAQGCLISFPSTLPVRMKFLTMRSSIEW